MANFKRIKEELVLNDRPHTSNVNLNKKFLCVSVLAVVMFSIGSFDMHAFAEISLSSYDSTIGPTDRLLIMGTIQGDFQSFNPIKLVVYDPSGNIVYQPDVAIDGDGIFKYLITAPMPKFDDGVYVVEASQEDLKEKTQLQFTVSSDISEGIFDPNMDKEIIPEFGTIATIVLGISILSIIIISAKNKMMFKSFTHN